MKFSFGVDVIGVSVSNDAALLAAVRQRFAARRGFALATINLDHLVKLKNSEAFRKIYAMQDLVVADGHPIVWLARLARTNVALVQGADLVLPLAREAATAGVSLALIGSTTSSLAAASARIEAEIPGIKIVMRVAPAMGFDPDGDESLSILRDIAASGAGLCFVAMGAPRQEAFAARGRHLTPEVGFASVGAGLDFLAGTQIRAPFWVRRVALEWLWRALSSPRRMMPRYAGCAAILPSQILAAWRLRQS